jgi:membrane fusion protein, multidrug efflux system
MIRNSVLFALLSAAPGVCLAQDLEAVRVESRSLSRTIPVTGEFAPYQSVAIHARVNGFVERILVDRGNVVKEGELLAILSAPEMEAQVAESAAKAHAAQGVISEAKARLASLEATRKRLKQASATPGAISGNEVEIAEQNVEAAKGAVAAAEAAHGAAKAAVEALEKLRSYLQISAPFAGVVTERLAHPGALAGPDKEPLLRIEQVSRLRLVAALPEANYATVARGARIPFKVAAYPNETFHGVVARVPRSMDPRTRTMAVELDVMNSSSKLAPGMYADVQWPARGASNTLVVPATSIATTTERVFVVRVRNGRAEWVDVRRGAREGDSVEVTGNLRAGDVVLRRGTDEVREGARVTVKLGQ